MMVLVTGGSGSGKSAFAERVACALAARDRRARGAGGPSSQERQADRSGERAADAPQSNAQGECAANVSRSHAAGGPSSQAQRPAGRLVYLATMDDVENPDGTRPAAARIARHRAQRAGWGFETVECPRGLGDLQFSGDETVLLEDAGNALSNELFAPGAAFAPRRAETRVEEGVAQVARTCGNLVVVTNEVGADAVPDQIETRAYVRALGRLSCRMAAHADVVCEVAAGVPNILVGASELAAVLEGEGFADGAPCGPADAAAAAAATAAAELANGFEAAASSPAAINSAADSAANGIGAAAASATAAGSSAATATEGEGRR